MVRNNYFHPAGLNRQTSRITTSFEQQDSETSYEDFEQVEPAFLDSMNNKRKFLVNTGFSFEITDYFKFQNQKQLEKEDSFFKDVTQKSYIAWIILLYSVVSSAMIPPWLMTIKADKFLRISWKCFFHLLIMMPFVFYQRRTGNQKIKSQYELKYIFNLNNVKKVCFLAFTASFWPTTILTTIQWTYISHSMFLGSLANLFLSLERSISQKGTKMEIFGTTIVFIGIFFVLFDSSSLRVEEASEYQWNVFNYYYLTRNWWQRCLADLAALTIGFFMSQFSKLTSDVKQYYPPYLLLFLNNLFTCFFMIFSAFFFNGCTFDADTQWGVFGLFSQTHFTNFLYMSIVLNMGTFISFVMVSKIFPDSAVPAIAMTLQPLLSTILFNFAGVQTIPGPFSCFGYLLITPGMITIISGNCLQTRTKIKEQIKLLKNHQSSVKDQRQMSKKQILLNQRQQRQQSDIFNAEQF